MAVYGVILVVVVEVWCYDKGCGGGSGCDGGCGGWCSTLNGRRKGGEGTLVEKAEPTLLSFSSSERPPLGVFSTSEPEFDVLFFLFVLNIVGRGL